MRIFEFFTGTRMSDSRFVRLTNELLELESKLTDIAKAETSIYSLGVQKEELKRQWIAVIEEYNKIMDDPQTENKEDIKTKYLECYDAYVTASSMLGELTAVPQKAQRCSSPRGRSTDPSTAPGWSTSAASASLSVPMQMCVSESTYVSHSPVYTVASANMVNAATSTTTAAPPLTAPPIMASLPNSSVPFSSHFYTQLPPCDTGNFNGDYHSWPSFRELFQAIYINDPRLSAVQKLYYLNS